MMKKSLLLGSLLFLMSKNVLAIMAGAILGDDQCVNIGKISHVPGQHWEIKDFAWTVSKESIDSITPFSVNTVIDRKVEPYHTSYGLAGVTCDYQSGTLVLTRTYKEGNPPFPRANYIIADTNKDKMGDLFFFNSSTSCSTTLGSLDKCKWSFYFIWHNDGY